MKDQSKKSQKQINSEKQRLFFYMILNVRGPYSEYTGRRLYGEINSCWFHHIFPKKSYPELRFCQDNIIMLTADEHHAVESGHDNKEVIRRKKDIIERYPELVKETEEYLETILNPAYEHAVKNTTFFK